MHEIQPIESSPLEQLNAQKFEIESFEAGQIDLKFRTPMLLPFGEISNRPSGILKLLLKVDGNEFVGVGEGATLSSPLFTDDYGGVIGNAIQEIVQAISTSEMSFQETTAFIREYKFENGHRYPTARMTVEMGIIDALAKSTRQNVADLLGVDSRHKEVPFGKSIGGRSLEETIWEVDKAIESNARKIKLKISPSNSNEVFEVLREVRNRHDDIELMVDANGTFDPQSKDHLRILELLDDQKLLMIEEPVSRAGSVTGIQAVRMLRREIPQFQTAVCLDDCLSDSEITLNAINENLCDIVNIKPGRIGSIVLSIELANLCKRMGKQIMVGGMFEATPGRIMTTTLAAYFNTLGSRIPGDLSLAQERLSDDLVSRDQQLHIGLNGGIVLPTSAGWGFDMDRVVKT